jgi:hypothetical protein
MEINFNNLSIAELRSYKNNLIDSRKVLNGLKNMPASISADLNKKIGLVEKIISEKTNAEYDKAFILRQISTGKAIPTSVLEKLGLTLQEVISARNATNYSF